MDDPSAAIARRERGRIPIWFGLPFAFMGALTLVIGLGIARDELRLANEGRTARATVAERWTERDSDGDPLYRVAYRFQTEAGATAGGRTSVSAETYAAATVGSTLTVTYWPPDPSVNRPGRVEFQPFPAVFIVAIGGLFLLVGVSLTVGGILGRRKAERLGSRPWPQAAAGRDGTYRFDRSAGRFFFDLVGPPVGIAMLLLGSAFAIAQPGGWPFAVIAAFFLVVMAAWGRGSLRRGLRREILTVGPAGIWTPESGLLPWASIRDVRLEEAAMIRRGRVRGARSGYRRLGIWPKRPVDDRGASWGAVDGYLKVVRAMGGGRRVLDLGTIAPYGVQEYELDVPLETVIPVLARFVPVLDARGRFLRSEDEARWADSIVPPPPATPAPAIVASPPRSSGTLAPSDVRRLDAAIGSAAVADPLAPVVAAAPVPGIFSTPSIVPPDPAVAAAAADPPLDVTYRFHRSGWVLLSGVAALLRGLLFLGLPLVFGVVFLSAGGPGLPAPFAAFALLIVAIFVLGGLGPLFAALDRIVLAIGPAEVLAVGPDGIAVRGRPPIPWGEVAEIRVGQAALVESGDGSGGSNVDRPRLRIVPRDPRWTEGTGRLERLRDAPGRAFARLRGDAGRRAPAVGIDLDTLDADPDDVIDLVDRFRRVTVD